MYSKFADIFASLASESGYETLFKSPDFRILVSATVIEEGLKNNDILYKYMDSSGLILFEVLLSTVRAENPSVKIPMLGKVSKLNKKNEYFKNYHKQKRRQIHLSLGLVEDADVISWLENKDNMQAYIKTLIRNDIKNSQNRN